MFKTRNKKYTLAIAIGAILAVIALSTLYISKDLHAHLSPDIGGAYPQMYHAQFWTKRAKNKTLLSAEEIQKFNAKLKNENGMTDLYGFNDTVTAEELLKKIDTYKLPNGKFYTGKNGKSAADEAFYKKLADNRNLNGIMVSNPVLKAITVNETEVRDFPSSEPLYAERGNIEIDMFCENRMYVWEKCLILHTSSDKKWYFIIGESFMGWINAKDAAVCDIEDWQNADESEKLVVIGSYAITDFDPYNSEISQKKLSMGTRLPLCTKEIDKINEISTISSHIAYMPLRDKDGLFFKKAVRIPKSENVKKGCLPFTSKNVVLQAFKLLGERYGWGGTNGARDCSSYIRDIYRCFGIELPKNSAMQGDIKIKGAKDLSGYNDTQKERMIKKLPPGSILEMKGHIMLYIGKYKGKPYVIHDVYAFGKKGAKKREIINCITVSDLYVVRSDGSSFLSNIRKAVSFDGL